MAAVILSGPSWTDKVTALSTLAAALVVGLSALIALLQLRSAQSFSKEQLLDAGRTRHGQLLNDLSRRWDEELLIKSRIKLATCTPERLLSLTKAIYDTGVGDQEEFADLQALANFLEAIAVQEEIGALSVEQVSKLWGQATLMAWNRWKPSAEYIQGTLPSRAQTYVQLKHLAERVADLREIETTVPPSPAARPTIADIDVLMGPATPQFAYQIAERINELISDLPANDPVRTYAAPRLTALDQLAHATTQASLPSK
jgi:hypothetical protein